MPDLYTANETKIENKKKEPEQVSAKTIDSFQDEHDRAKSAASFCYFPENVRFTTQDPEEKIVLLLRQHPITNCGWIVIAALMLYAPKVLQYFPILAFLPDNFQLVAVIGWYLIVVALVFEKFLSWYFSVYIITDERVIDVDFLNLIYREITASSIDKIQDVTVQSGGAIMSLFNYGNVFIQTAAERPLIEFDKVPKPDKVARILRKLIIEEEQEKIEGRVR